MRALYSFLNSPYSFTLGLAVVVFSRVFYVLSLPNEIEQTWRDGLAYDSIARNLVSGMGYWDTTGEWPGEPPYADPTAPTARWMPGYPIFVAAVYTMFGATSRAVYLSQAGLAVLIATLTYLLAKQTSSDRRVPHLAVFLYAVDPLSLSLAGSFQTEQLFTLLTIGSIYLFVKTGQPGRFRLAFSVLFGVMAGMAALTRNVAGLTFAGLSSGALLGWDERFARVRLSQRFLIVCCVRLHTGSMGHS